MTTKSEATLSPDILMMLGKMDGKLDSLLSQTATNTAEIKDLNVRVSDLEASERGRTVHLARFEKVVTDVEDLKTARSEAHGGMKGVVGAASAARYALCVLAGVIGALGLQVQFAKKSPTVKSEMTIERSITVPKH
ncbi:hypothetical protein [Sphingobium sp. KCTC 72723]|uniref:hypothetical protein n=1 Tax=Sphingobium sp. KCTC 72723 TaxID=2733867 RepID=UPI00165DEF3F|nr:hypothetical protein [Sphingobium sp. KCTC 72723]